MALLLCCVSASLSSASGMSHRAIHPLSLERDKLRRDPGCSTSTNLADRQKGKVEMLSELGTRRTHVPGGDHQRIDECRPESLNAEILELGPETDDATYAGLLRRCSNSKALSEGKRVHEHLSRSGYAGNRFLSNLLIQMYSKCGSLNSARDVFDKMYCRNLYSWNIMIAGSAQNGSLNDARTLFRKMPQWDVVSWNAMIAACAQNGHGKEALQLFGQMQAEGYKPTKITFICIVDACTSVADLEEGQSIHATIAGNTCATDVFVGNALANMYGKCGSLDDAKVVFEEMSQRTVVSWNAMISVCIQNGSGREALQLFGKMQAEGFEPNTITFICIVDACASVTALEDGRAVHAIIACNGWEVDVVVGNALVNMYGKCGSLDDARAVFAKMSQWSAVSWSAMIAACSQNGHGREALQLHGQMQVEGFEPNKITCICIVDACACVEALEEGKAAHATIACNGWDSDVVVGNALVNMYGKCECLEDARAVFMEMPQWDVVSWSVMIGACAQSGQGKEALQLFGQMQAKGFEPNRVTFICVLDACASVAALEEGRVVHATVAGNGWESDVVVGTTYVNMYGKCGNLNDASVVFMEMPERNLVSWNAMITACAQNGHGKEALRLFGQLQAEGFQPDRITFISMLSACSHTGLTADGMRYFMSMNRHYGIIPSTEHYACMIDLLGRRGLLEEAEDLIFSMPFEHVSEAWLSLLSSCRIHNDLERALRTANFAFALDPGDSSPYVLLADIYANV